MKWTLLYLFLAGIILTVGCKTDELSNADIVSSEAEFAIPLGKVSTSVEDLLENFDELTSVEIAPDNVVHVRYQGDVLTQYASEFFQDVSESIPPIIPMLDTNFMVLPFSSPEVLEVDRAVYKSGNVSVAVNSLEHIGTVQLTVVLPQVQKAGVPLSFEATFESPFTGPLPVIGAELPGISQDVAGYELIPENGDINVQYAAVTDNGNGDTITLDAVSILSTNVSFSFFEGFLGDEVFNGGQDTIQIDFFNNWTQGDVFFEDPEITIKIENSFGMPTRSVIEIFDILTVDGLRIPLRSEFIDTVEGIDFPYPLVYGEVASLDFVFDKTNSNIDTVLGARPIALDYKVDARLNPENNVAVRGFISDESFYKIQVEVDLPMHGRASGFGVTEELAVDFSSYDKVKEAEFKLVADNGMPFDIDGQAYFLDGTGAILDSLFDTGKARIIGAAEVDNDGNVTAATTQTTFAAFDADRFENIRHAEKISLQSFFSTFNNGQQSVRAMAGQEAEIRMGLKLVVD